MDSLALEITKLIGSKELSFGCLMIDKRQRGDDGGFACPGRKALFTHRVEYKGGYRFFFMFKPYDGEDDNWHSHSDTKILENNEKFLEKFEIIGHPATLSDLHRWMNENELGFCTYGHVTYGYMDKCIRVSPTKTNYHYTTIPYDSSLELLEQSEETLTQILSLIKS